MSEDAPEQFQRVSRDRVGPVVCEEMSRAVDDVADKVVRLVAVYVEHPWADPASAPPKSATVGTVSRCLR